jgi:hypothetical protein
MSHWSLDPIAGSLSLALGLCAALLALLWITPGFGGLTSARTWLLSGLRLLALVILALLLLRPTHSYSRSQPQRASLVVLFDQSRSMQLPDRGGRGSRWAAQTATLTALAPALAQLAPQLDVRMYGYDTQLHPLASLAAPLPFPTEPAGEQTDIGGALEGALQREAGQRIAAVLLLGDGTQTATAPTSDSFTAARRLGEEFAAPLYTTIFGPSGDAVQSKDIALEKLDEQYTVFVKNEAAIRGRLRIAGFANQPVPLLLEVRDATGKVVSSMEQRVAARTDGESVPFEFPYTPQQAGHFKLTVTAQEQPGELLTKNNALSAYLTVLEGGLRLLGIDSGKRPEYKFLRRALSESPDMELDDFVIDITSRKTWPVAMTPLLQKNEYDVLLLGNIPAAALGDEAQQQLLKNVEQGRGLLVLGGVRAFGAGNYLGSPLANALPLTFDRFEKQDFDSPDRRDLFLPGPLALQPQGVHPVTRLAEGAEGVQLWSRLPPLDFANRFSGVKTSPGVRVLLTGPRQEPLLVAGEYGSGRVLAFAGESTYRWVLEGFAPQHKRFWRQALLWLARRDETQQSDVWIKLAQRRFAPGASVAFSVGARSPEGEPLSQADFRVTLIGPDGKSQPARTTPGADKATGAVAPRQSGDYALEVTASLNGKTLGTSRAEFFVYDQDNEMSRPVADHEHFARLSRLTHDYAGRAVPAEDLAALLAEIAARPPEQIEQETRWRFGDDAGSAWLTLLTLTLVLGTEWWLRKRWGLV